MCVWISPRFNMFSKGSFSELIFKVSRQGETAFDYIYTYLLCPMKLGNQVGSRSWWFLRTCSESTIFNFSTCIMARWPNQKPPMSFTAKQGLHGNFPELNRVIHHRRLAVFQVCVCVHLHAVSPWHSSTRWTKHEWITARHEVIFLDLISS